MIWTVTYKPAAIDELADEWNRSPDKQAIADASDRIDQLLRNDPDKKGQPLNGDRILVVDPLAAVFSLSPDDCLATVLHVFRIAT